MSDDDLPWLVHRGVEKALSYNLSFEDDVQRFLEFTIMLGAHFDEQAEPRAILERDDVNGMQKMDSILYSLVSFLGATYGPDCYRIESKEEPASCSRG